MTQRRFGRERGQTLVEGIEMLGNPPRDAQRDFGKQAEKQRADLDEEDVILCHTGRVLRECLPHVRGLSALDARLAEALRVEKPNDRRSYEYR